MLEIPENLKQAKLSMERHIRECQPYADGYHAASIRISQEMKRYNPAWAAPETLPYTEGVIWESQSLASRVCPKPETRRVFLETACRLEPYGCVSARACRCAPNQHYIILDTGVGDFFGNLACLIFAIFEQEFGHHDYGLDTQAMVSKLWGLALIYYDYGFQTNNEALLYPHFKFGQLRPMAEPYARVLSTAAQQFFLYHEFGHVVDETVDASVSTEDAEYSADMFAFTALRETAFAAYERNVVEFVILGCVLALLGIEFIESTFSNLHVTRGGVQRTLASPTSSYPCGGSRTQRLLGYFPAKRTESLDACKRPFRNTRDSL